jgi:plasmid stability protein
MTQLLIRNLDDMKIKLQERGQRHGRSTKEEMREILRNAVRNDEPGAPRLRASACASCSEISGSKKTLPSGAAIRRSRPHSDDPHRYQCIIGDDARLG